MISDRARREAIKERTLKWSASNPQSQDIKWLIEQLDEKRKIDDKWQMYMDGIITWKELSEWRKEQGFEGDWMRDWKIPPSRFEEQK